jgi:exodeoxyribonuclease VII small subunit
VESNEIPEEVPETPSESLSFEEALERLENIVDGLEQGDLELQDALGKFEKGVALTRQCAAQLDDAERRIEVLVKEGEKWLTRPLDVGENSNGASDGANGGENIA